jgi:hypothetical protein
LIHLNRPVTPKPNLFDVARSSASVSLVLQLHQCHHSHRRQPYQRLRPCRDSGSRGRRSRAPCSSTMRREASFFFPPPPARPPPGAYSNPKPSHFCPLATRSPFAVSKSETRRCGFLSCLLVGLVMRAWRGSGSGSRCTSTAKPSSIWWSGMPRPSSSARPAAASPRRSLRCLHFVATAGKFPLLLSLSVNRHLVKQLVLVVQYLFPLASIKPSVFETICQLIRMF